MIDIAFVVLHYLAIKSTIKCIESIERNIDTKSYKIIVVNNASPDDSTNVLHDYYKTNDNIVLINLEKNMGFANGNNVGFLYAKNTLKAKYIVLCNNDTVLYEKDLLKKINESYETYHFAVLGPMIVTKDGRYTSSPVDNIIPDLQTLARVKTFFKVRLLLSKCKIDWLYFIYNKLKISKEEIFFDASRYLEVQKNVILHGSFLIFSDEFIKFRDGLNSNTFMYMEEDILYWEMVKSKKVTIYNPDILIFHEEDSSTNELLHSNNKKKIFKFSNLINSLSILEPIVIDYWNNLKQ